MGVRALGRLRPVTRPEPFLPSPAAVLGADVGLGVSREGPQSGRQREGHSDSGQTLQLAGAPAKTFPHPAPPLIINLRFVCKQQLGSFVRLPSSALPLSVPFPVSPKWLFHLRPNPNPQQVTGSWGSGEYLGGEAAPAQSWP